MNRTVNFLPPLFLLILIAFPVSADIIETLNREGSSITVEQPELLGVRLSGKELSNNGEDKDGDKSSAEDADKEKERPVQMSKGKVVGYRVQVYADNNAKVAKSEARQRASAIAGRFPYATYVAYVSPYWRLRVGDFKTQAEADKAAADIRRTFPRYAREIRVVRDRINTK